MQVRRVLASFAMLVVAFSTRSAAAQQPVCRPVGPTEHVYSVCRPLSLIPTIRLLSDFTVDQLFKPSPPDFERSMLQLAQPYIAKEMIDLPPLRSFLRELSPVRFTQLDRTTGTIAADFSKDSREFQSPLPWLEKKPTIAVSMPEHLEGGYWRGPDVLQIAFWERKRIEGRMTVEGEKDIEGSVDCISISPAGVLIRFLPDTVTPVFFRFTECPL